MGLLKCNHPLLQTPYRFEVVKPSKEHQKRLIGVYCTPYSMKPDHSKVGTAVWPQFHNNSNPTSLWRSQLARACYPDGCSAPGCASGRIHLDTPNMGRQTHADFSFLSSEPEEVSCMRAHPVTILPNNVNNVYRRETLLTEDQRPALRTVDDFRVDRIHPAFRTSYRYQHVMPRPADATAKPMVDKVRQLYTCFRYGAAQPPYRSANMGRIPQEKFMLT